MARSRQLVVFISDLHLTDGLEGPRIARRRTFERFWKRIAGRRGDRPARIVFVGDLFDIVRSPRWLAGPLRPYHDPGPEVVAMVETIVDDILRREEAFLREIRSHVLAGRLEVDYLIGNHDRLLGHAPQARRRIWRALTGEDVAEVTFPTERVYPEHGVLAYHGNVCDFINYEPEGGATIGDAIAPELILRFPKLLRQRVGHPLPRLDDIDDVRPIYAVPSWVRHYAVRQKGILKAAGEAWRTVVDDFLDNPFTQSWMKRHRRGGRISEARKLSLILQLSTGRIMRRTRDHRLAAAYKYLQHFFDGRFARPPARRLQTQPYRGLRYVVNGHSHFPSMTPLGDLDGRPGCYFNTGTWRTVHQMGRLTEGRPGFLAFDAMAYLVFFPETDELGRDFEWWTGALVARETTNASHESDDPASAPA